MFMWLQYDCKTFTLSIFVCVFSKFLSSRDVTVVVLLSSHGITLHLYPRLSNLMIQLLSYLPILSSLWYPECIKSKMSVYWLYNFGVIPFAQLCIVQPPQIRDVPVLFCLLIVWYALHMCVYTVSPPQTCSTQWPPFTASAVIYIYFEQGKHLVLIYDIMSCHTL